MDPDPELVQQVASTTRSILQTRRLMQRLRFQIAQQHAQIAASRRHIEASVTALRRAEQALAVLAHDAFDEPGSPENQPPSSLQAR